MQHRFQISVRNPLAVLAAGLLSIFFASATGAAELQSIDGQATQDHAAQDHAAHDHANQQAPAIDVNDPHAHHKQAAAQSEGELADIELPEGLSLLNQRGERLDLRRDAIGERVVVVNFVYTNCTTVCPVTSSIFSMLQQSLGERMGKDVALVTITVDPARDTPHRLLKFSQSFNPGAAWNWLTGDKGEVDRALRAFGVYTPNFDDHPAMVLIGDARQSRWHRLYGFPAPQAIEDRVTELLNNRST